MNLEKTLSPTQIIDLAIKKLKLENDNQLATYLGVERQQIRQYRNGKGGNLNCKLLTIAFKGK